MRAVYKIGRFLYFYFSDVSYNLVFWTRMCLDFFPPFVPPVIFSFTCGDFCFVIRE